MCVTRTVRVILVRHCVTAWNAEKRFQGMTDMPLSNEGKRQAAALAQRLAQEKVHAAYSSDLRRSWETALVIAACNGQPPRPEPRLRELDFGAWEGLTPLDVQQRYPKAFAAWQADPTSTVPHNGEPISQLVARVDQVLYDTRRDHQHETVLLVAHGFTLQMLLCRALNVAPQGFRQYALAPASVSEVTLDRDGGKLVLLNDTHHLMSNQN